MTLFQIAGRSIVRPALIYGLLWAALYLPIRVRVDALIVAAVLSPVLLDLLLAIILPWRQGVADFLFKTLVVNRPLPQPHRAPAAPMYSPTDAEFGAKPRLVR